MSTAAPTLTVIQPSGEFDRLRPTPAGETGLIHELMNEVPQRSTRPQSIVLVTAGEQNAEEMVRRVVDGETLTEPGAGPDDA